MGGGASVALLIDTAYELFGFPRRSGIDVAQRTIEREALRPNQAKWIFDGL